MYDQIIYRGTLKIEDDMLKIKDKFISISKIDSTDVVKLERYPLLSGIGLWFKGLIVMVVISLFCHGNSTFSLLGDLYCYSIFLLLAHNLYRFLKLFYGLVVTVSGKSIVIASRDEGFIYRVFDALNDARKSVKEYCIINLDNCVISTGTDDKNETGGTMNIINNGIVSIGDNNVNTISNEINYEGILEELEILKENCSQDISSITKACEEKDYNKLIKGLKKLGKVTINVIKELGLSMLIKLIENNM